MEEAPEAERDRSSSGLDGVDQPDLGAEGVGPRRRALRGQSQEPRSHSRRVGHDRQRPARRGRTAIAVAVFVAIGSITVVGAVAFYLATPTRAAKPLGAVREFMAANNATIMMVILLILGVKLLGDALSGVWS